MGRRKPSKGSFISFQVLLCSLWIATFHSWTRTRIRGHSQCISSPVINPLRYQAGLNRFTTNRRAPKVQNHQVIITRKYKLEGKPRSLGRKTYHILFLIFWHLMLLANRQCVLHHIIIIFKNRRQKTIENSVNNNNNLNLIKEQ